ncbi:MAG: hypothetical protein VX093_01545 [Pseudomonadota bacterium]|nr:hypothetical protein [Pseudomonadota bacterium]
MNNIIQKIKTQFGGVYKDDGLTIIKVSGTDNIKFLQGQLTNDLENLSDLYIKASYCTHQGKVITNMQIFLSDDEVILIVPKKLGEYFIEKISKYILMSDVKFIEYKDNTVLWALDDKALELINEYKINEQGLYKKLSPTEYVINMSDKDSYRFRYIQLSTDNECRIKYTLPNQYQTCLIDILSMHSRLKNNNMEKYIPQVLNSDRLETVSYKKGCYTGQEVIARTHYLGNVKKHLYLICVKSSIGIDSNVVNKDGESVGELIGEQFQYDGLLLSHCILRDSSDFSDLLISNEGVTVLSMEETA